ncbi:MAG: hypothetical protein GX963_07275, partial [Bacteroidales bacterium]|nr:hypothetical protein [Bacteroidales bacterium]
MKELHLHLENCYGIRKLKTNFCFSKKTTQLIYAPNGTMKTSLAKTFDDFSKQEQSKDLIYTDRETKRHIVDEEGNEIS